MKSILAVALVVAFVAAEVPSNSYLPPPPNQGYPQSSGPSIVAARTLDQGPGDHHRAGATGRVNGFARSGLQVHSHDAHSHGPQARSNGNGDQGYDHNAAGFARKALDGISDTVSYEADERGFEPQISNEDSEDITRSGYDASANNFRANNGNGYHGNEQDGGHSAIATGY